jgi:hypothetical protein
MVCLFVGFGATSKRKIHKVTCAEAFWFPTSPVGIIRTILRGHTLIDEASTSYISKILLQSHLDC